MTSLAISDPGQRRDLAVFVGHALRLDEAAVIRLRTRADGLIAAWVATGFDVLAVRVFAGRVEPADVTCAADALFRGLTAGETGEIEAGYAMDSAWRTALPPETGFVHVDDVPEAVMAGLARSGADLAREHAGPQGPPPSLLDQDVLEVSGSGMEVAIPMRVLLALAAMRFTSVAGDDVVRVRALPGWLRLDARYGSLFRRRGDPVLLLG